MTRDATGQLIWLEGIGNTVRIEVGGSSAVFTGMAAFKLQPTPFSYPPGNSTAGIIFGWNTTAWNLNRRYLQQVSKETVLARAKASSDEYFDFPAPLELTFNQSVSMCRRLGGKLPVFASLASWQSAYDAHRDSLPGSNVKTVKEQTFHKRSTNVLLYNRNKTKND